MIRIGRKETERYVPSSTIPNVFERFVYTLCKNDFVVRDSTKHTNLVARNYACQTHAPCRYVIHRLQFIVRSM